MTAEQLSKILDELGQRLGPAGEHVFQLAVRQSWINGLLFVIGGVLLILTSVAVFSLAWRWTRETYEKEIARGVFGFFCLVGSGAGAVMVMTSLSILLNPEYAAIRDLLSAVGR